MRDVLIGATTIAVGICLAAVVIVGAWLLVRPAHTVMVSLSDYSCATDGKTVKCARK